MMVRWQNGRAKHLGFQDLQECMVVCELYQSHNMKINMTYFTVPYIQYVIFYNPA